MEESAVSAIRLDLSGDFGVFVRLVLLIENGIEILIDKLLIYKGLSQRLIKRHIEGVYYELKATSIFYKIGGDGTLPKGCGSPVYYGTEP